MSLETGRMDSEEAVYTRIAHSAAVASARETGSHYSNSSHQEGSPTMNSQTDLPPWGWAN